MLDGAKGQTDAAADEPLGERVGELVELAADDLTVPTGERWGSVGFGVERVDAVDERANRSGLSGVPVGPGVDRGDEPVEAVEEVLVLSLIHI